MTYRGPIVDYKPKLWQQYLIAAGWVLGIFLWAIAIASTFFPDGWHEVVR